MYGKEGIEENRGPRRAFELKALVESRLCRIVTGDDDRKLNFEYDTNIPRLLIGGEKELGELITIIFGYTWDRLDRGGLDVAVQGLNENDGLIKVQFSFCENRNEGRGDDSLYQECSFRNAEDDGSEFRMVDELCSRLGIEIVTLLRPNAERYLAFVMQFTKVLEGVRGAGNRIHTDCLVGKRLLLVEDNSLYREVLKGHFVQWGIEVKEAGDAESAIEIMDESVPFDFGVFDISLPGKTGKDLARYCRSRFVQSEMRIISLSGVQKPSVDDLFDERLVKPTMPDVLKKLLIQYSIGLS